MSIQSNMKDAVCVILLFLCACSPKEQNSYEYTAPEFKKTYKAEIVPLNKDIMIGDVLQMYKSDDKLILQAKNIENKNEFQVFSEINGEFLGAFGFVGRGDKELSFYFLNALSIDEKSMISVDNNCKMMNFDLTKATEPNNACAGDAFFVGNKNRSSQLHCLSDGSLLHIGSPRIFITDPTMFDTIARYNEYPRVTEVIDANSSIKNGYFGMNTHSAVNTSRTKLATVTHYGMLLEIFDLNKDAITPTQICRFYEPRMASRIAKEEDCVVGAMGIVATDNYIYTQYSTSTKLSEIVWNIGVFDWQGREVCCYTFEDNIQTFTVTSDDKRAYCWVQNADGEEFLGYFDLK